jgi:glycerophosphoryl diester phosphodiesterase
VCHLLNAAWPDTLPQPLVSSFAYEALEVAARVAPSFARGLLLEGIPDDWRRLAEGIDAATVNCDHTKLTMAMAHEIRLAGYGLMAYTVNHAGRARELYRWGVNSVFSDVPEQLLTVG